jgi:AcrR family transcriptional regulator
VPSEREPVRARARRALRGEITSQALGLFSERGFDAVTADELAEAVGVSRRTLFRLFATKEDIVVAAFEDLGDEALTALRERPADEAPWRALRHALGAAAARLEERPALFFDGTRSPASCSSPRPSAPSTWPPRRGRGPAADDA